VGPRGGCGAGHAHAPGVSTGAGLAVSLLRSARCGLELGWAPDGVKRCKTAKMGKRRKMKL